MLLLRHTIIITLLSFPPRSTVFIKYVRIITFESLKLCYSNLPETEYKFATSINLEKTKMKYDIIVLGVDGRIC
jgi:hypothetical protein